MGCLYIIIDIGWQWKLWPAMCNFEQFSYTVDLVTIINSSAYNVHMVC